MRSSVSLDNNHPKTAQKRSIKTPTGVVERDARPPNKAKPHIRQVQEFAANSIRHQPYRLLCNNMKVNELQIKAKESLICFQKKSCLLSKEVLFTTQRSLLCIANKAPL